MKNSLKNFIWFGVSFILILIIILFNLKSIKINAFGINFKEKKIEKIIKRECNISELNNTSVFLNYKPVKTKKKKKIIKKLNNKIPYVKDKTIIYHGNEYKYLADVYKKSLLAVFKTYNNKTVFYELAVGDKLDDTNITLIKNNEKELVFEYNKTKLIIKKDYVDIKKYQKDNNESK